MKMGGAVQNLDQKESIPHQSVPANEKGQFINTSFSLIQHNDGFRISI